MIPFNIPHITGKEPDYIQQALLLRKISGDGAYTGKCHHFFEQRYGIRKALLTTSCTHALEMCALLIGIKPGDEVIIPSYTFASTANAFVLRGAKIVFADSGQNNPDIDAVGIEKLITPKTRAIVVVHYAGIACDMDTVMELATRYNLFVIEDAAQAVDSYYKGKPLGTIGHLGAYSFHETKSITSGEGGMLAINDELFIERAGIIREKGTNRGKFMRGEIEKYEWVDIGSSFLPSDIIAAFLYAQLESLDNIQKQRKEIWQVYYNGLEELADKEKITLPCIPAYATNNAAMFYLLTQNAKERTALINTLKQKGIHAAFHYSSLHKSPFYTGNYTPPHLPQADRYTDCLLRLPLYYTLNANEQAQVVEALRQFYNR